MGLSFDFQRNPIFRVRRSNAAAAGDRHPDRTDAGGHGDSH